MDVKFTGKRLDNGEEVIGFFTKKKIGNLIVPVIETYKEWDSGDYIESREVDGETISQVNENNKLTVEQLEILMCDYCKEIGSDSIVGLHVCDNFRDWMVKELMKVYYK